MFSVCAGIETCASYSVLGILLRVTCHIPCVWYDVRVAEVQVGELYGSSSGVVNDDVRVCILRPLKLPHIISR